MMTAIESPRTFNSLLDAQQSAAPRAWGAYTAAIVGKLREFAQYAAILMLPGGSVMAVLLWLYRRQKRPRFYPAL
jgi:hypothetical protein